MREGLSCLLMAFALAADGATNPPTSNGVATVTVDVSHLTSPPKLRQGFLHGINTRSSFPAALRAIDVLRPSAWRLSGIFEAPDFVVTYGDYRGRFGTRLTFNLNDYFSQLYSNPVVVDPACARCFHTYEQLRDAWTKFVSDFMQQVVATKAPIDVYDLFSEPDWSWKGITATQFFDLLKIGHDGIRKAIPTAVIVAPSISWFSAEGLTAMMQYCANNGVHLDGVAWHEFGVPARVPVNVDTMRKAIAETYAAHPELAPSEIHINEYATADTHLIPGWSVAWLSAFEQSGVDYATRACWNETATWSDCAEGFDGMTMNDDSTPQAVYWVYAGYAGLASNRLTWTSSDPAVWAIASRDDTAHSMRVLVGNAACSDPSTFCQSDYPRAGAAVALVFTGWPYGGTQATATVTEIPFAALPGALTKPNVTEIPVTVEGCQIVLPVQPLDNGAALTIEVHYERRGIRFPVLPGGPYYPVRRRPAHGLKLARP